MTATIGDGAVITVEIGFAYSGTPNYQPVGGLFANITWTDVSSYVRGVQINRGRSTELDSFQTGAATVTLSNRDRRFDPEYASGPYYGSLTPLRPIRIKAQYGAGATTALFSGFIDGWPQSYINPGDSVVSLNCSDAFKVLSYLKLPSYWETMIRSENAATTWWRMDDGATPTTAWDTTQNKINAYWASAAPSSASLIVDNSGTSADLFASNSLYFNNALLFAANNPLGTTPRTVAFEMWFNTTDTTAGGAGLFRIGVQAPYVLGVGMSMSGAGVGTLTAVCGTYSSTGNGLTILTSNIQVNDGNPHHVAFYYDQNSGVRSMWVDGVAASGTTEYTEITTGSYSYNRVGTPFSYSSDATRNFTNYFTGKVDEVILYNNSYTMTQAIAQKHYEVGIGVYQYGERSDQRVARILNLASWPSDARTLGTGSTTVAGFIVSGKSALDLLKECEAAEQARLFIGPAGDVQFISRQSLYTQSPYNASQYTFGDSGAELRYSDIQFSYNDQLIKNDVKVSKQNGGSSFASDATSQQKYWTRSESLDGLIVQTEYICTDIANARVLFYKEPSQRIDTLTFSPRQNPSGLYPVAITATIGTRITVNRRPQGVGSAISKELLIEGISHDIGPKSWTTTLKLSPAPITFFILNNATYGVLDTSRLGY